MRKISFDFESGEIRIDYDCQHGVHVDLALQEKESAILKAAGFEQINIKELRADINNLFDQFGLKGVIAAEEK